MRWNSFQERFGSKLSWADLSMLNNSLNIKVRAKKRWNSSLIYEFDWVHSSVFVVVWFGFLLGWKTSAISAIFYLYITSCIIYGFYSKIAQKIYAINEYEELSKSEGLFYLEHLGHLGTNISHVYRLLW